MKRKLLIVDDHEINRKILKKFLSADYDLFEAENGEEALSVMRKYKSSISAVLLDLVMPKLNAFGVLKVVRNDQELKQIPIIVMTQVSGSEVENKILAEGEADFIRKPYNPGIILKRLDNLIELHESKEQILEIEKDELTGLYTKNAFCRKAAELIHMNPDKEYIIVGTNIEKFKLINDSFGIEEGDKLLKYIATQIKRDVTSEDGLCARLMGDHFVAISPKSVDDGDFHSVAEQAREKMEKYPLNTKINVKFGIYPVDNRSLPIDIMCDRAMIAANSIKGRYGSSCAYYDDSMRLALLKERQITDSMRDALEQGQFRVYMQPKYDLRSERIAGAEALVRWIHPHLGFMNPDEFIPLFERNGFIIELDRYMWDETCRVMAEWKHTIGKELPVSVNVSRNDIYHADLPQMLMDIVEKYGLEPRQLHLEITETAYVEDPEQLIGVVSELKDLGFVIEMDDFGSGYSSLNILSTLPIDILKLDMRFIQQENEKNASKSILSFIISLAKWMNLLVIAEGVETQEQIDYMRNMECNYVQGYYYAKPMPYEAFTKMLEEEELAEPLRIIEKDWNIGTISESESSHDNVMLIVDDQEVNRSLFANCFKNDYKIIEADNGLVAFRYIRHNYDKISVVLLDLIMPVMDGFQLLERMKENPFYAAIPVIVASQAGREVEARAFEMGASDFVSKPYDMNIIRYRVTKAIANNNVRFTKQGKKLIDRMHELSLAAKLDQMTGLYNRMEFEQRVDRYFSDNKNNQGIFIMLDIDDFKNVNDLYGHDRGDEAICKVAKRLQELFRKEDTICRMGGDEFAVFIGAHQNLDKTMSRLDHIRKRMNFTVNNVKLSCSMGICTSPEHGKSFQELYHNADTAMLAAKQMGKNCYQVYGEEDYLPKRVIYRNLDWLLDETSDVVFVSDAETYEVYYMNNMACELAGKSRKECIGKPCYKAMWDREEPCSFCIPMNELSGDYCEHTVNPNGTDRSYYVKGKRITWGARDARIQYVQDDTNRVRLIGQLEEVSAERQALLFQTQAMIDNIPGAVCLYDWNGKEMRARQIGKQFSQMFDVDEAAALSNPGNMMTEQVYEEDMPELVKSTRKKLFENESMDHYFRLIKKGREKYRWIRMQANMMNDPDGSAKVCALFTDVTEIYQLREEMRQQRDMLEAAVEQSGMVSWMYDFDSDKISLTIASERLLGIPNGVRDLDIRFSELGRMDEEGSNRYKAMLQAIRSGSPKEEEIFQIHSLKDDEGRWFKVCYTVVERKKNNDVKAAIGTALDVTTQKEAEQSYNETSSFLETLSSSLLSSYRIDLTTGAIEESHSDLGMIESSKDLRFTDETFKMICEKFIPSHDEVEKCYSLLHPSKLREDYENGVTEKDYEYPAESATGQIKWLKLKVKMLRKPSSGDIVGFFTFWDITNEKTLQSVFDDLDKMGLLSVFLVDAETGTVTSLRNGKVIKKDPAFESMKKRLDEDEVCSVYFSTTENGETRHKHAIYRYFDTFRKVILCSVTDYCDAKSHWKNS